MVYLYVCTYYSIIMLSHHIHMHSPYTYTYTYTHSSIIYTTPYHTGPNADWLKNTSPIWLLTNDHPGQNRSYCSVAMQLLGQNHTLSFYRPLHEIDRAHYVIRLKNAYISPYGSAATECGLVMGVEGCETRFGHIQMWHNKCMDMLHKSNMNFNVFFSSNFSYYSKLRVHNASEYETILKDPPSDLKALLDVLETCVERSDQASVDKGSSYLPTYHKKVLMVDACWDFNFYHFVGDGLVRAAHLWEVVRMDTSIMIHINRKELLSNAGDRKKHEESAVKMRKKWLHLLGKLRVCMSMFVCVCDCRVWVRICMTMCMFMCTYAYMSMRMCI
ncbi:hypothetical protein EON63_01345 [archaeon]|nr:MAG: hypothetical protein EON63_01345 [archaeon]